MTCENQRRADERIPILLSLPFRHKGICVAPMISPVEIEGDAPSTIWTNAYNETNQMFLEMSKHLSHVISQLQRVRKDVLQELDAKDVLTPYY